MAVGCVKLDHKKQMVSFVRQVSLEVSLFLNTIITNQLNLYKQFKALCTFFELCQFYFHH